MSEINEIAELTAQVLSLHGQIAALSAKLAELSTELSMTECENEDEPDGSGRKLRAGPTPASCPRPSRISPARGGCKAFSPRGGCGRH